MPSARRGAVTKAHTSPSFGVSKFAQQARAASLRRRCWGRGRRIPRVSLSHLHLPPPPPAVPALSPRRQPADPSGSPVPHKRAPPPAAPPARPHLGFPRPRGPRPQRDSAPDCQVSRCPEGGAGRGRNHWAGAGETRGPERQGSEGAASPAVRLRDWPGPRRRPPLIGGFSNSVSRRQRRCFSGDPDPGLQSRSARRDAGAVRTPRRPRQPRAFERGSARFAFPARCCHPAADRITPLIPRGREAVQVP